MAVTIHFKPSAVEAKITTAWEKGLPLLASEILNDCNEFCKEDTGTLIASSYIHSQPEKGLLIWQTPYARRQYWEIQTAHKSVNPGASWKWAEVAKQKYFSRWAERAKQLIRGNL